MEKLEKVIGPAPSEMTAEELVRKIESEHRRVGAMLQAFREQAPKQRGGKRTAKARELGDKDLKAAAERIGVSLKEFFELVKKQQEREVGK